ncbi:inner membrane protein yaah [Anaeramoeba flamelloides]|uniref:Inner membrane protein yaah n=1 Tax=Anaeramoeba flamelloides TaxID=1746091 RepID=A0ABQ8Z9V9_9EUKA|nr:inner membrane protein yaah [Anaeramoeba flamelloides]
MTSAEEDRLINEAVEMEMRDLNDFDLHTSLVIPKKEVSFPQNLTVKITKTPIIVADPSSIGYMSLAIVTLMLSFSSFGATSKFTMLQAPWVISLSGLIMVLSGIVETFRRKIFGSIVFLMYGFFWLAYGSVFLLEYFGLEEDLKLGSQHVGVAIFGYTIFNLSVILASLSINFISFVIFVFMELLLLLLCFEHLESTSSIPTGFFYLIISFLSFYYSFALVINSLAGGQLIPLGNPIFNWNKLIVKNQD